MSSETKKIRLGCWQRRALYWSFGLLWLTGAWWVGEEVLQWFSKAIEPRSASQVAAMKAHGALAMAFLLVLGSLMSHVQRGWALRVNRILGSALMLVLFLLSVTGWLLYYAVGDDVRNFSSIAHWALGMLVPVLLWAHITWGRR